MMNEKEMQDSTLSSSEKQADQPMDHSGIGTTMESGIDNQPISSNANIEFLDMEDQSPSKSKSPSKRSRKRKAIEPVPYSPGDYGGGKMTRSKRNMIEQLLGSRDDVLSIVEVNHFLSNSETNGVDQYKPMEHMPENLLHSSSVSQLIDLTTDTTTEEDICIFDFLQIAMMEFPTEDIICKKKHDHTLLAHQQLDSLVWSQPISVTDEAIDKLIARIRDRWLTPSLTPGAFVVAPISCTISENRPIIRPKLCCVLSAEMHASSSSANSSASAAVNSTPELYDIYLYDGTKVRSLFFSRY
jgi:hypothetical protein